MPTSTLTQVPASAIEPAQAGVESAGDWETGDNCGGSVCIWVEGDEEGPIARLPISGDRTREEMQANARLMAASKDLRDSLADLAAYVDSYPWGDKWAGRPHQIMDNAREALRKAGFPVIASVTEEIQELDTESA